MTIEIREGAVTRWALDMAGDGTPGRGVRLVFPIDPEATFAHENPGRREAA